MILVIKCARIILNFIYLFFKLLPTKNKITMISRQSNKPSQEFEMLRDKIVSFTSEVEVVMLCHTLDGGIKSKAVDRIRYGLHMFKQMYHIATSKVVILDSYCIAISILKHKKNVSIIQMWHSMGSMKKFGYTAIDTEEGSKKELAEAMRMHKNYDYVFASSEVYKDHLAKGFGCDIKKIITMPLPRVDLLKDVDYTDKVKNKVYNKYPKIKDKAVILYCPTFRKDERKFGNAVQKLIEEIDFERYQLVVKKHPLSKVELPNTVIQAEEISSFDMLFVADYVISDYSCIVYEAAVRDIPLYFYNYDMEEYIKNRGLAIDYMKELPGIISSDPARIIYSIENEPYDMERLRRFSEKYIVPTDNATSNITDFIFQCMDNKGGNNYE